MFLAGPPCSVLKRLGVTDDPLELILTVFGDGRICIPSRWLFMLVDTYAAWTKGEKGPESDSRRPMVWQAFQCLPGCLKAQETRVRDATIDTVASQAGPGASSHELLACQTCGVRQQQQHQSQAVDFPSWGSTSGKGNTSHAGTSCTLDTLLLTTIASSSCTVEAAQSAPSVAPPVAVPSPPLAQPVPTQPVPAPTTPSQLAPAQPAPAPTASRSETATSIEPDTSDQTLITHFVIAGEPDSQPGVHADSDTHLSSLWAPSLYPLYPPGHSLSTIMEGSNPSSRVSILRHHMHSVYSQAKVIIRSSTGIEPTGRRLTRSLSLTAPTSFRLPVSSPSGSDTTKQDDSSRASLSQPLHFVSAPLPQLLSSATSMPIRVPTRVHTTSLRAASTDTELVADLDSPQTSFLAAILRLQHESTHPSNCLHHQPPCALRPRHQPRLPDISTIQEQPDDVSCSGTTPKSDVAATNTVVVNAPANQPQAAAQGSTSAPGTSTSLKTLPFLLQYNQGPASAAAGDGAGLGTPWILPLDVEPSREAAAAAAGGGSHGGVKAGARQGPDGGGDGGSSTAVSVPAGEADKLAATTSSRDSRDTSGSANTFTTTSEKRAAKCETPPADVSTLGPVSASLDGTLDTVPVTRAPMDVPRVQTRVLSDAGANRHHQHHQHQEQPVMLASALQSHTSLPAQPSGNQPSSWHGSSTNKLSVGSHPSSSTTAGTPPRMFIGSSSQLSARERSKSRRQQAAQLRSARLRRMSAYAELLGGWHPSSFGSSASGQPSSMGHYTSRSRSRSGTGAEASWDAVVNGFLGMRIHNPNHLPADLAADDLVSQFGAQQKPLPGQLSQDAQTPTVTSHRGSGMSLTQTPSESYDDPVEDLVQHFGRSRSTNYPAVGAAAGPSERQQVLAGLAHRVKLADEREIMGRFQASAAARGFALGAGAGVPAAARVFAGHDTAITANRTFDKLGMRLRRELAVERSRLESAPAAGAGGDGLTRPAGPGADLLPPHPPTPPVNLTTPLPPPALTVAAESQPHQLPHQPITLCALLGNGSDPTMLAPIQAAAMPRLPAVHAGPAPPTSLYPLHPARVGGVAGDVQGARLGVQDVTSAPPGSSVPPQYAMHAGWLSGVVPVQGGRAQLPSQPPRLYSDPHSKGAAAVQQQLGVLPHVQAGVHAHIAQEHVAAAGTGLQFTSRAPAVGVGAAGAAAAAAAGEAGVCSSSAGAGGGGVMGEAGVAGGGGVMGEAGVAGGGGGVVMSGAGGYMGSPVGGVVARQVVQALPGGPTSAPRHATDAIKQELSRLAPLRIASSGLHRRTHIVMDVRKGGRPRYKDSYADGGGIVSFELDM